MTTETSRTSWWILVIVLAIATVAAVGYGSWRAIDRPPENDAAAAPLASAPADSAEARQEAMNAASQGAVKLLSYRPATAEADLTSALDLTVDPFRSTYSRLIRETVIPSAQRQNITSAATVPAAAISSLTTTEASVLLFINQSTTTGDNAPADTLSSVRVGMVKKGERWLIKAFDPV